MLKKRTIQKCLISFRVYFLLFTLHCHSFALHRVTAALPLNGSQHDLPAKLLHSAPFGQKNSLSFVVPLVAHEPSPVIRFVYLYILKRLNVSIIVSSINFIFFFYSALIIIISTCVICSDASIWIPAFFTCQLIAIRSNTIVRIRI